MAVCLSVGGRTVSTADGPCDQIVAGTVDGVVSLTRPSPRAGWQQPDRFLPGQMVNAVTLEPTSGVLFAATQDSGIFASADGGRSWRRRDRGIAFDRVWTVTYVRAGGELRLYAGTEPAHLYVSTDLGESWEELAALRSVPTVDQWFFPGQPNRGHVKHVSFDPSDPETIYVSIEVGGVLKSVDGGRSWRVLSGFYEDVHRVLVCASDPRHLHMATGEGLYQSDDAGETWTYLGRSIEGIMYADPLIMHPRQESVLYFAGATTNPRYWYTTHETTSKFLKTVDGGATWQVLRGGLPDPILGSVEALGMAVWPAGSTVAAGTTRGEVFVSDDDGATWSVLEGLPGIGKDYHVAMLTPAVAQ